VARDRRARRHRRDGRADRHVPRKPQAGRARLPLVPPQAPSAARRRGDDRAIPQPRGSCRGRPPRPAAGNRAGVARLGDRRLRLARRPARPGASCRVARVPLHGTRHRRHRRHHGSRGGRRRRAPHDRRRPVGARLATRSRRRSPAGRPLAVTVAARAARGRLRRARGRRGRRDRVDRVPPRSGSRLRRVDRSARRCGPPPARDARRRPLTRRVRPRHGVRRAARAAQPAPQAD